MSHSIENLIVTLGFSATFQVSGRHSIADLLHPDRRCGIYILHFENNEYYIGQAIDVVKRLSQHKKNHDDIVKISFKPATKESLHHEETEAIWSLEKSCILRNITVVSTPQCESDLDAIFDIADQEAWLVNNNPIFACRRRSEPDGLRGKYTKRFNKISGDSFFLDNLLPVLQKYVRKCIPEPYLTEVSFWGCTCLPSGKDKDGFVYSRINLYWNEVLTVGRDSDEVPFFSWHLSESPFNSLSEKDIDQRFSKLSTMATNDHYYKSGGMDQFNITLYSKDEALSILDDVIFLNAAKSFNLRNMRRGAHVYARYHCMDLADLLLDG